jgi:flagella basal body P-ring formation protein FlgA
VKALAFLAWLALTCGLAQAGTSVTIALRQAARVTSPIVTLGDVALLASSELEPLRTLVNLPIGRAPAAGETLIVQREALAPWILAKTGLASETLQWTGPAVTQLVAAARRVSGEEIAAAAEVALRGWLNARVGGGEVQLRVPPRDLDVPDGELELRARVLDRAALHSRMLVWLEVWVDQRFIRAVAVPFQVEAQQLLPAALNERTASKAASAKPIVMRGEWAALRSGAGAVSLEARVEVLQDGRMGDIVRVRQPGAAGGVIARVTGPGQLELAR